MVHQSRTCIMKIIEKCDARQDTGLQYKHKEITHISRRRAIKNTRSFAMQYKKSFTCWERNFFPRAKAMEERKKQASKVNAMASSVRGE